MGIGVQARHFAALLAGAALFSLGVAPVLALSTD